VSVNARSFLGHPFETSDEAATTLTHDERAGLIPSWVTYRHELNEAEQENVAAGRIWAFRQRRRELLEEKFLCDLHERMLGRVWRWAGKFRTTERNIGRPAWQIGTDVRMLLDDARTWIAQGVYGTDEVAVRFHHRLVFIHPFPNGNGRHSRLMADLLLAKLGAERFSWGGGSLKDAGTLRARYIAALRSADRHDYRELLQFVRL
jgi:Fic-DOC domain mobile mystery protein B